MSVYLNKSYLAVALALLCFASASRAEEARRYPKDNDMEYTAPLYVPKAAKPRTRTESYEDNDTVYVKPRPVVRRPKPEPQTYQQQQQPEDQDNYYQIPKYAPRPRQPVAPQPQRQAPAYQPAAPAQQQRQAPAHPPAQRQQPAQPVIPRDNDETYYPVYYN